MLPAGFWAGGADRIPGAATRARRCARCWARPSAPPVSRHVRGLFRLRPQPRVPDDALASLSRDLRPGPDAERRSDRGDRRHQLLGSLAAGWLGARYPKHILLGLLYILRAFVFTAYFMMPPTPATTLLFAAAMGMLWLSVAPLVGGLVAEMFGTRYMATLLGISFVMHQVGSSLGAWGGGSSSTRPAPTAPPGRPAC